MAYTTIDKSSLHFNTKQYTGNASTNVITGVGFQPDLTWTKATTYDHCWYDVVRGVSKRIKSNTNAAEDTNSGVTAFGTDGFTLGSDGEANTNSLLYTSWNWKAGGGQGSSNTDGSINTTYTSANTTSGFSISKYTGNGVVGATVGHGLGVAPKMIMVKKLGGATDWMVYHESIGNDHRLRLNTDAAKQDNPVWNDTTPTSSVFSMNDNGDANASGGTYVAYCFSQKTGFSKFDSYTGNGNADGTFTYTGFKPAFVVIKKATADDNWILLDNRRDISPNPHKLAYFPNTGGDDAGDYLTDFVSNGFKIRSSTGSLNSASATYIYMAFAEAPLVGSNNVPCTAR